MACVSKASTKATAALDKACFVSPATFPSCYDGSVFKPNSSAGWVSLVEAAVDSVSNDVGCGSPSGAFLAD